MGKIEDSQLVAQAAGGDAEAFTELVRRYRDTVYGYCYHRTGSFEDGRDLAQETFVRAYTRLEQLRDGSKLGAWLRKIAANLCTRWAASRRELPAEQIEEPVQQPESTRAALVREALSGLPENERLAVVMHYVDGLTYSDIAQFLEITPGAVRGRLARGREMLRAEVLRMTRETFDENKLGDEFVMGAVDSALSGATDTSELIAYHTEAPSDDCLSHETGNWWKWRWVEGEVEFGFRTEMYKEIVAEEDDKRFAIRYSYAVKRPA